LPQDQVVGDAVLVRGSPSSLLVETGEGLIIVDPGHGGGKVKSLKKALAGREALAVVTHYHSDHFEVLSRGKLPVARVAAPRLDAPGVEHPEYRLGMTFGYPLDPGDPFLVFPAPPVRVDMVFEPGSRIWGLETVPLPGHTPGQAGIVTPGGVLYAGDALFGDKVLERYALPYHRDTCRALETLEALDPYRYEAIVPGHGPVVSGDAARGLVDKNIASLKLALDRVVEALSEPASLEALARRLLGDAPPAGSVGLYMLLEQSLRGMLLCLARRGLVEAVLEGGFVVWRRARA